MAVRKFHKPLPEESLELQRMRAEEEQRRQAQQAATQPQQNTSGGVTPTAPTTQPADNRTTQQLLDDSKKAYTDYLESDEHRQNIQEANRRHLQQALQLALTPNMSTSDMLLSAFGTPVDNRERELNAVAEHYDTKLKQEENAAVLQQNLDQVAQWDESDRNALEQYVSLRGNTLLSLTDESTTGRTAAERMVLPLYEKYGRGAVERAAEAIEWQRSQQLTESAAQTAQELGNRTPALAGLAYSIPKAAGNVTGTLEYMTELGHRTGQFSTLNPNNIGNLPNTFFGGAQEQIAQNIEGAPEESTFLSRANAMAYRGTVQAVDNGLRMAMSVGNPSISAGLAASGTFGNSLQQYSAQGASPAQAVAMATVNTALEYYTEKLSDSEMLKFFEGSSRPEFVKSFLWQTFGVEPTTEEINLFAGVAAEVVFLGDKNSKNLQIGEMVANGMSYEEAERQYLTGLWRDAAETYAMTAISGGVQAAGTTAVGNLARRFAPQNTPTQAAPEAPMTPPTTESVTPPMTEQQQAQAAVEQAAQELAQQTPAQEEAPRTEGQKMVDNAIADTLNAMLPQGNGTISNSTAERILANPEALNQLTELTGAQIAGTKAEQRRAVKNAVAQLFSGKSVDEKNAVSYNETTTREGDANYGAEVSGTYAAGLPGGTGTQRNVSGVSGGLQVRREAPGEVAGISDVGQTDVRTEPRSGGPEVHLRNSGELRVSDGLRKAQEQRNTKTYPVFDTTAETSEYEAALTAGRDSDTVNGWCVTPKSAQELQEGNVRTFMNEDGTIGAGIAPDGDIVAVFKNKANKTRRALDTLMPIVIEQGGDRL